MVAIFQFFRLLTPAGRREARARRWDAIADRAGARKRLYGLAVAASGLMGVPVGREDAMRVQLTKASNAERVARQRAEKIRRGER